MEYEPLSKLGHPKIPTKIGLYRKKGIAIEQRSESMTEGLRHEEWLRKRV